MKKTLLLIIGTLSLGLGVVGIFLPVLPTTPFLLLALTCYMKSSQKMYDYILSNKYLSFYVKDYMSHKGIPVKAKLRAILLIWFSIGFSIIFIVDRMILRMILLVTGISISIFIWTRKTRR